MRVAVIGAGYAGIAAAVALARAHVGVTLYEANRTAGGRARRIEYRDTLLDNGQHLLLGAYSSTLELMREVGVPDGALLRMPLTLVVPGKLSLRAPRLPAPLHLAWALLTARGLTLADRIAATRLVRAVRAIEGGRTFDGTVARLLDDTSQTTALRELLWGPLCVAAMNTPVARADATTFAHVLHDSLLMRRADSDLLVPTVDLSALLPDAALAWRARHGCDVRLGERVTAFAHCTRGWSVEANGNRNEFDAIVCAVAPFQVPALVAACDGLADLARGLGGQPQEPIATVYLQYDRPVRLPHPMIGLTGGHVQWLFDREALSGEKARGLVAAVISANGPHRELDGEALGAAAHAELAAVVQGLPAPTWTKTITEKRATFACEPDVFRPAVRTAAPGLWLAGDYTAGRYPATLEGAVRSGRDAARGILESTPAGA